MSFADGIKDLLKYKIVSNVNTGDKNLDNIYNALLLSFLAFLFTPGLQYRLYHFIMRITSKCMKPKLTKYNYNKIRQYVVLNADNFQLTTWLARDNNNKNLVSNALSQYIIRNYHWIFNETGTMFIIDAQGKKHFNTKKSDFLFDMLRPLFKADLPYPIYINGKSIVALRKDNEGNVFFMHSDDTVLTNFIDYIVKNYEPPNDVSNEIKKNPTQENFIHTSDGKSHIIYKDRCFDKIVTKHKNNIINSLNSFIESNQIGGKSKFNGLSNYNLGFLFHGPPGTGKTSIIKAICNYLDRDAVIIDMRKIKTITELNLAVETTTYAGNVFVFDEFDCVQDLLQRKSKSSKEEIKEIQNEINKLLAIQATSVKSGGTPGVDAEIKQLQENIKTLENQLNLDNMLTWLDGTIEARNRIIIAATNCIEKIDPALIREGRFDVKIYLEEFDSNEINEILKLMYGEDYYNIIDAHKYKAGVFTPAKILNIAQQYNDIHSVIKHLCDDRIKLE